MNVYNLLGLLSLSCLIAITPAKAERLVIYGDEAYPPVIYLDKGKPAGILPAIFARLQKDTGDQYELVLVPWKRALYESQQGRGGITTISWNKERDQIYDFSESIYYDNIQLVVLKGKEFPFKNLIDLKGKKLGGAAGASYGEEIDNAITSGLLTVDRDPNQDSRLRKLLFGRMDVALIGNGNAGLNRILDSVPDLKAKRSQFVILPQPLTRDPLYLAFAKSMHKQAAIQRFNQALKAFKKTPEYQQITLQ